MFDDPMIARIVAPNLTASFRQYSDAQLAVIIRRGLRRDGRTAPLMPAEEYMWLTDADLGRIMAFLKSLPPADGPGPGITSGPLSPSGTPRHAVLPGELHSGPGEYPQQA